MCGCRDFLSLVRNSRPETLKVKAVWNSPPRTVNTQKKQNKTNPIFALLTLEVAEELPGGCQQDRSSDLSDVVLDLLASLARLVRLGAGPSGFES